MRVLTAGTARASYYGDYYDAPTNDPDAAYFPDLKLLVDLEARYNLTETLSFTVGGNNLFDEYPQKNPNGDAAGLIYPEGSPFSFNGGFYYLRATWRM